MQTILNIYRDLFIIALLAQGRDTKGKSPSLAVSNTTAHGLGPGVRQPHVSQKTCPQNFIPGHSPPVSPGDSLEMLVLRSKPRPTDLTHWGSGPSICFRGLRMILRYILRHSIFWVWFLWMPLRQKVYMNIHPKQSLCFF